MPHQSFELRSHEDGSQREDGRERHDQHRRLEAEVDRLATDHLGRAQPRSDRHSKAARAHRQRGDLAI